MAGETELARLIAGMDPVLVHREVVVVSTGEPVALPALAMVHEEEGTTFVVHRGDADRAGLAYDFVAAWITLRVHSALAAVGLTAAFSAELARHGISCNVLAGAYHDHLLVPHDRALDALRALRELAIRSAGSAGA